MVTRVGGLVSFACTRRSCMIPSSHGASTNVCKFSAGEGRNGSTNTWQFIGPPRAETLPRRRPNTPRIVLPMAWALACIPVPQASCLRACTSTIQV